MIRARAGTWQAATLGVAVMSLLASAGCSAGAGSGTAGAGGSSVSAAPPKAGAASATQASASPASPANPANPATPAALAKLDAALRHAAGSGKPGTEQLREAVTAAGFPAGNVQVAASRTPTGLDADAVEVGVRDGGGCLVGQVRNGTVNVILLPVLADGRCLVGTAAPGM